MNNKNIRYRRNVNRESYKIIKLFVKILLTCALACLTIIFLGWTLVRDKIEPPVIPNVNHNIVMPSLDDFAFLPLEEDEEEEGVYEDMYIGGGLRAPEGFTADDRKDQFFTFLIIGLDDSIITDTIMVASYDGINREANIISIPRDSLVNVRRRVKKISVAYPVGTLRGGGREGGIAQLQREIKTIIGFIPDFYISLDYDAFIKLVDAVGGIVVYVPIDMRYTDRSQGLRIDIRRGEQRLNGENALKFARYRRGSRGFRTITDYQRIENQQTVIRAMLAELMRPSNILRIPIFLSIFNEHVHSDISVGNMLWFADQLNQIKDTDALSMYTMPTIGTSGPPMHYELLDKTGIIELVNRTINPFKIDIEAKDLDIITRY